MNTSLICTSTYLYIYIYTYLSIYILVNPSVYCLCSRQRPFHIHLCCFLFPRKETICSSGLATPHPFPSILWR